jgi:hypothetical protein
MNFQRILTFFLLIIFFAKLSSEFYASNIIRISSPDANFTHNRSAVILVSSHDYLMNMLFRIRIMNKFPIELKFIIYCIEFNVHRFSKLKYAYFSYTTVLNRAYFLRNNEKSVSLLTINTFLNNSCKLPRFEKVNSFVKKTLTWDNQLKINDKYSNFNSCLLVAEYISDADGKNFRIVNGKLHGFQFEFFELMARRGNFIPFHHPNIDKDEPVPEKYPNYNYYFSYDFIVNIAAYVNDELDRSLTTTFDEIVEGFVITPSEAYSSYEKLILPFDEATWICLILTFAFAYCIIFITNFLSRKMQDIVYGRNITTPAFNVIAIFFGIGQTRLPGENFSRIILMIFILFCLIIRTAYQGVLFDFMTKDMRKPVPKTIAELKDRGFVIYFVNLTSVRHSLENTFPADQKYK